MLYAFICLFLCVCFLCQLFVYLFLYLFVYLLFSLCGHLLIQMYSSTTYVEIMVSYRFLGSHMWINVSSLLEPTKTGQQLRYIELLPERQQLAEQSWGQEVMEES